MIYKLSKTRQLRIEKDTEPVNSRDPEYSNNFGKMYFNKCNYNLPQEGDFTVEELVNHISLKPESIFYIPLSAEQMNQHLDKIVRTKQLIPNESTNDVLGFIYCTAEEAYEKKISKQQALVLLENEVIDFNKCLQDNWYGFILEQIPDSGSIMPEELSVLEKWGFQKYDIKPFYINACYGFYGWDPFENGMLEHLDLTDEETAELKKHF